MTGNSSGATSYGYNGLGQRMSKRSAGALTASYFYDEQGHLIEKCAPSIASVNECDKYGHQQVIWLDDIPVAAMLHFTTFDSEGYIVDDLTEMFRIHTDHLNTPRHMTRAESSTTYMWSWRSDPFGVGPGTVIYPNYNAMFQFDLRFPGQVFDAESGMHYNYFRDYDPNTGRYVQSDPIGLQGGLNTYLYADANPIGATDPSGQNAVVAISRAGRAGWQIGEVANGAIEGALGQSLGGYIYDRTHEEGNDNATPIPRDIWWPEKKSGKWVCKARADCNDNIPGNCPEDPKRKFAFGGGEANDIGTARNIAKGNATSNLQCQPKHVSCKCTGPTGERYSGGC